MSNTKRTSHYGATYLLQRAKSAAPSFRYKPSTPKIQRQPSVVLYVDENCPVHSSQGNCTCRSFINDENGLGSTDSLHQNVDSIQQNQYTSNNDLVSTNIKPFHNNPPLPLTQRDVVGNNLYFNSLSQMNGWNDLDNEQLSSLMLYRDALKQNLTTPNIHSGFPKKHFGRSGGHWSHIKQTNTYSGSNLMFIDGTVRNDNTVNYPTRRFGFPSMNQPQYTFTSSNQDMSNPTTKSCDVMTWSTAEKLNHRPSLSQYSNRYERHAKDGFSYWPTDLTYKKPRCTTGTTGTYKTWLGLSDSILKL